MSVHGQIDYAQVDAAMREATEKFNRNPTLQILFNRSNSAYQHYLSNGRNKDDWRKSIGATRNPHRYAEYCNELDAEGVVV